MKNHPIPSVTDPLQYRAIGLVRGIYKPQDDDIFTRGALIDSKGNEIDSVVLGRVITLIRNHVPLEKPHLWVVYPRCRNNQNLHLQITGIWEPSTLKKDLLDSEELNEDSVLKVDSDSLLEGDDYFSIRGELIFTKPEEKEVVIKIRQKPRNQQKKAPLSGASWKEILTSKKQSSILVGRAPIGTDFNVTFARYFQVYRSFHHLCNLFCIIVVFYGHSYLIMYLN